MESENIPHHPDFHDQEQQQRQQVGSVSSSSSFHASSAHGNSSFHASSAHGNWYGGASRYNSNQLAWSPNTNSLINNAGNRIFQNFNTQLDNNTSRPYTGKNDEDEGIQIPWGSNSDDNQQHQTLIPIHDPSSNKSKLNLVDSLQFPKFTDMISSTHSSIEDIQHLSPTAYLKNDIFEDTKLLLKSTLLTPSSGQYQFQATQFLSNAQDFSGYEGSTSLPLMPRRGNFSQIFPSVNISNLNNTQLNSTVSSSPLYMNAQALDLLTSPRFGGGISHDQTQSHALGQQHLQLSSQRPTCRPGKLPSNFHGEPITYTKRPQTEHPGTTKTSSKKSRTESPACPPFKVRKEKLGDRIAALQQLVAPFGKTDTASVLMEAIGYIKFLQNQVETLSVPYMKSSGTRTLKPTRVVDQMADADGSVESRRDLRSRGLCLVPFSCVSYVTNDDSIGWPLSDYHGGT